MRKSFFILLVSIFPMFSCVKELDGPNTLSPEDPKRFGTLVVFMDWQDFDTACTGVDVTLDGFQIGQITTSVSNAYCYDNGAITIDSVLEGDHLIYAGPCKSVSWQIEKTIFADQCNVVKLTP